MALTPEQAEAYEQLEAAIHRIAEVCGGVEDTEIITGWALGVTGIKMDAGDDDIEPGEVVDEQSVSSKLWRYSKRGQAPLLTRGIIEAYLDVLRD